MIDSPLQTPLHDWHASHGGRLVEFAGWTMPLQYTSIVEEHTAVRTAAGLFDISHMGRLVLTGPDRVRFLDSITTNHVAALEEGQAQYSFVTNERGGILDDVLVYRFPEYHLAVCNASNRESIVAWMERHVPGYSVQLRDCTFDWCMFALQGPKALEILAPLLPADPARLRYYHAVETQVLSSWAIASRTGYTGEDGIELILPRENAVACWETLLERGRAGGLMPAGLGARDTLRLEAAMALYGHELSEEIDPFQAGLGSFVKLDKEDFVGRAALAKLSEDRQRPVRIGLELRGRRIAREGAPILNGDQQVGHVTSGTFSPTLQKAIAMGYVQSAYAAPGQSVVVDVRGRHEPAVVVKLPFYRRPCRSKEPPMHADKRG